MKPLNHILIFTKEYRHEKISASGGTGVFYKNLAEEFVKRGLEVTVFGSVKKPVSFSENDIRFHFVKDYFRRSFFTEMFRSVSGKHPSLKEQHLKFYRAERKYLVRELKKFLAKNNLHPQIIETHDWEGIFLFLEETRIPYVVRCHGSWNVLQQYFGYKKVPEGRLAMEKEAFQKSKNNIVISEFSAKVNREIFGINDAKLIYNGIDTEFYSPAPDDQIIPQSLFFLGHLSEEKGADTALKAFKKINEQWPESTLRLIGKSGDYPQQLEKFLNPEQYQKVVFHGPKNPDEVRQLLSKADLMLFPSKGENFSLSLLEAMAMAKPVICADIPAFAEIITHGENGMISAAEDAYAEHASALFSDRDLRNRLANNARETVVKNFSAAGMIDKTLDYYQKIYERFQ